MSRAGASGGTAFSVASAWIFAAILLAPPVGHFLRPLWGAFGSEAAVTGLLVGGTLATALYAFRTGARYRGGEPGLWLAALVASALLSCVLSSDFFQGFPHLGHLLMAVSAYLLAASLPAAERRSLGNLMPAGMILGGAMAALYAAALYSPSMELSIDNGLAALPPAIQEAARARLKQGRAFAFFVYPNAFAGYLLLGFPAALGRILDRRRSVMERIFWGLPALLMGWALLASGSIGAAVCLLAALGVFAIFSALSSGQRAGHASLAMVVSLLILALVLAVRGIRPLIENSSAKTEHWLAAAGSLATPGRLLVGHGPGRYGEAIGIKLDESIRWRHAHNWLVETFAECGILGLAALVALIGALLRRVVVVRSNSTERDVWGLKVGWIAMLGHSLIDIDYALPLLAFPWWCAGGYLASLFPASRKIASGRMTAEGQESPQRGLAPALFLGGGLLAVPYLSSTPGILAYFIFIAVAAGWILSISLMERPAVPVIARMDWPWLTLLGWGVVWIFMGAAPGTVYRVTLEASGLLSVMLLSRIAFLRGGGRAETWLRGLFMAAIFLHAAQGILQAIFRGGPAQAGFPSPNIFASFMLAGTLLGLWSFLRHGGAARVWAAFSATVAGSALLASRSSAAMLSTASVAAIMLALEAATRPRRFLLLGTAAVSVLAGTWISTRSLDAGSVAQRITMWREAAYLLRAEPGGRGPGSYAAAAELVRQPSVTSAGIGRYSLGSRFAHNEPIQFAVEWGLPAMGIMSLGLFVLFSRGAQSAASGWAWPLVGLLILGILDFPLRVPACKLIFAVGAGLLSAGHLRVQRTRSPRAPANGRIMALAAGILAAIMIVRPAASRWANGAAASGREGPLIWGDRARAAMPLSPEPYLMNALARWPSAESPGVISPEEGWKIREYLKRAFFLSGGDAEIGISLGRFLLWSGAIPQARAIFLRAVGAAPTRPHPWLWIARTYEAERDWTRAIEALAQARRREPFYLEAIAEMGIVEEYRGDPSAARRSYRAALMLRAKLSQRTDMNRYEAALCRLDEEYIKGRLLDLGAGR